MNRDRAGWLLPPAAVFYVALSAQNGGHLSLVPFLVPLGVAAGLWWLSRRGPAVLPHEAHTPLRLLILGVGLFAASSFASADDPFPKAAGAVGLALSTGAALISLARLEGPRGLLLTPRAATSLDALWVALLFWSLAAFLALSRSLLPELSDVDPPSIDTAYLFSSLGTLLLLVAALLRARILRGLELGISDRTSSGLALAVAGTGVGAGSGFLQAATADLVSGITLAATNTLITWALVDPSASRVARLTRGGIALVLLGAPTTLLGAWLALRHPERPATIALAIAGVSMGVGLAAHRVTRPLGPAGSRWLDAVSRAMTAALHPQPDLALRGALSALKRAESLSKQRPELFRYDPPSLLSVDVAGYLTERDVEFPQGVYELALGEPGHTLRAETVRRAQVRRPDVRPLVAWFEAHGAKSATALADAEGPVGLLALPSGRRTSTLSQEEVESLGDLAERMTGILSVTSALARAHRRQLEAQNQAEAAGTNLKTLSTKLKDQAETGRAEAELCAEVVRRTAHGPAAQIALQQLERHASEPVLFLDAPPGADLAAWAAHAHLTRPGGSQAFVVLDCASPLCRSPGYFAEDRPASPLARALGGSLVLAGANALSDEAWTRIKQSLTEPTRVHVIAARSDAAERCGVCGPSVTLPRIEDRAEDLQSLIVYELARIGLVLRGAPLGIARAGLALLLDRSFSGNEAELRGLLWAAAARSRGETIQASDLEAALRTPDAEVPAPVGPASLTGAAAEAARTRKRLPPRSRRS